MYRGVKSGYGSEELSYGSKGLKHGDTFLGYDPSSGRSLISVGLALWGSLHEKPNYTILFKGNRQFFYY